MGFNNPVTTIELAPDASISVDGASSGTPTVGYAPTFAIRNVSASSTVSATLSRGFSGTATATLIPAPAPGVSIELHALAMQIEAQPTGAGGDTVAMRIVDHVTGAVLAQLQVTRDSGANGSNGLVLDFQGVRVPAGDGLDLQVDGTVDTATAGTVNTLTYELVA